ncbi:hypothetical protein [Arthrobacter sp. SD76]|uniref:hypothetical protein n=1 Tax=Arthrobacter sp. SD76 TaxID=3415007 RepID=UPI003C753685
MVRRIAAGHRGGAEQGCCPRMSGSASPWGGGEDVAIRRSGHKSWAAQGLALDHVLPVMPGAATSHAS